MTNNVINILTNNTAINPTNKITETLSKYTEKTINGDKSVTYTEIITTYFLDNDEWHLNFFGEIEQFNEQVKNYKYRFKSISFLFNNENVNKEMKFIVYNKLFSDEWGLQSVFIGQMNCIRLLAEFINEKYPDINSLKELDLEKTNILWLDWLHNKGIKIYKTVKVLDKEYENKTHTANYLGFIINTIDTLTDDREEWEKDIWDVRNL